MMPFDLPPDPQIWLPPKPAIIRPAEPELIRPELAKKHKQALWSSPFLRKLPAIYHRHAREDAVNRQDYTFTDCDIGPARRDRRIAVAVGLRAAFTAPSSVVVTVGGAACSETIKSPQTGNGFPGIYITTDYFPAGETADVIVDTNQNENCCGIDVFAVYGLNSITPEDTGSNTTDGAAIALAALSRHAIVLVATTSTTSGATCTFTNVAETSDHQMESGQLNLATGTTRHTAGGALSVTADWTNSSNVRTVVAAWR